MVFHQKLTIDSFITTNQQWYYHNNSPTLIWTKQAAPWGSCSLIWSSAYHIIQPGLLCKKLQKRSGCLNNHLDYMLPQKQTIVCETKVVCLREWPEVPQYTSEFPVKLIVLLCLRWLQNKRDQQCRLATEAVYKKGQNRLCILRYKLL